MSKIILIKLGEIWLKGKNRDDFVNQLVLNIQSATGLQKKDIKVAQGRIYAYNLTPKTYNLLRYVFGIHSFVEAYKVKSDLNLTEKFSHEIVQTELERGAKTFKVDANRADKTFEKNSMEINQELGSSVLNKFGKNLSVDVKKPNFVLNVEIRKSGMYIYSSNAEIKGAGGLPVGISGKGLLMLSGGIDSPVAGWSIARRGMRVYAVHFVSPPYTGEKAKEKVFDICRTLAPWNAGEIKLFIVPFTDIQTQSAKAIPDPLWTLVHRRFMVRISHEIAKKERFDTLISGESLGQVASQTIENISAVSYGINFPILRPLISFDKQQSVNLAKKIDTYRISVLPYEDCCTVFASKHPKTKAKPDEVACWEKKLDSDKLIKDAISKMEIHEITK